MFQRLDFPRATKGKRTWWSLRTCGLSRAGTSELNFVRKDFYLLDDKIRFSSLSFTEKSVESEKLYGDRVCARVCENIFVRKSKSFTDFCLVQISFMQRG